MPAFFFENYSVVVSVTKTERIDNENATFALLSQVDLFTAFAVEAPFGSVLACVVSIWQAGGSGSCSGQKA